MLIAYVQVSQFRSHPFHYSTRADAHLLRGSLGKQRFSGFRLEKCCSEVAMMSATQVHYQLIGLWLGPGSCHDFCRYNWRVVDDFYRNRIRTGGGLTCGIDRNSPFRIIYAYSVIFKKRIAKKGINFETG